jgi:hypothetical protein
VKGFDEQIRLLSSEKEFIFDGAPDE